MTDIGYGSRAVLWDKARNIGGAIHKVEAGKRTDMMFHTRLTKVLYLLGGEATLRVIKDGQVNSMKFEPGSSISLPPGFMYQVEAASDSIVVEFVNDPSLAYGDEPDNHVISRGTTPMVNVPEQDEELPPAIVMTDADKAGLEEAEKKTTKKKSTRKKRSTKTRS